MKSSDRHCFGDPSFESKWVKYCVPDGKDYVKREERSGSDTSLVVIFGNKYYQSFFKVLANQET